MKKVFIRLFGLAVLAVAGWGGYRFVKQLPERQDQIPTTKVQQSDVVIRAYSRGELRAVRTATITAPNLGGNVQVTAVAPNGALAHEKDLIVEFDDSERRAALEQNNLQVRQADEQIAEQKANIAIQKSQDDVNLLRAKYSVRNAELDVQRAPVLSEIDAKKNALTLEQAKKALAQLQSDIQSRYEQGEAQLAVLAEQRNRALIQVRQETQRLQQTKQLSPIEGLVAVRQNRTGNQNFGQTPPDIRDGDNLQPGVQVADVLDLSELEVVAKVGELDRANLQEGQEAQLRLDALPDQTFRGKIKSMSGTASQDVFSGDPSKKFEVVFSLDMRQLLTALGMKPADIDHVMATAVQNAKRPIQNTAGSFFASLRGGGAEGGGFPGGGDAAPAAGGPGGGENGGFGGGRGGRGRGGAGGGFGAGGPGGGFAGGQGGGFGAAGPGAPGGGFAGGGRGGRGGFNNEAFAGLTDEQRQQAQQLMRQGFQSGQITAENRDKAIQDIVTRVKSGQAGSAAPAGGNPPAAGRGGAANLPGGDQLEALLRRAGTSQYSDQERANAKLPVPPEEDSQVQVLLRPGLLADVQIQIERIANALHVPAQAVFTKNGKPTVFVQQKNGRFEPHEVQLSKQSESVMVLSSGVEPGQIVALADPTASKSDKKDEKKSQGNAMGGLPGGK
ncbi:MAG: HlyD family efflux transporter periplasmic adaptor subunit [Acidobacteriia bacterium]|nr:HlyD family efflux transporter periplasmic adaptor subunit [Terriglobia bacterium]